MSVCVCVCVYVCVRFFGLINFKIGKQLLLGPLKTKPIFFGPKPFPSPTPPQKGNSLGISITPQPFDGFSSNFQITCLILIRNFWKKNLSRTSHLNWVITQPLLKYDKFWILYFCPLTPPRRLKISTSHFQLCIPLLHRRF